MRRFWQCDVLFVAVACVLFPVAISAQVLMGALIGTVKDDQGGVLPGASVRVSSPALIGGTIISFVGMMNSPLRWPVFWGCAGGALAVILYRKAKMKKQSGI